MLSLLLWLLLCLGLLIAGLLLFPLRLSIEAQWHNFDQGKLKVSFYRWQLWPQAKEAPLPVSTPTQNHHIPRSELFQAPESVPSPSPRPRPIPTAVPLPKVESPALEDEENPKSLANWKRRLIQSALQSPLWMAWAKWLLSLIGPTFHLLRLEIKQLHLEHSHRDPFFSAQVQSAWYTLEPILNPHQADLRLSASWGGHESLKGKIRIQLEHRLYMWIPWLWQVLWGYPWRQSFRSWRRSGRTIPEQDLNAVELKLYKWAKVDSEEA